MKASIRCAVCVAMLMASRLAASSETIVLPNGLSVVALQCESNDVCAVHVALAIGPDRVPAHKAGVRALTQQVLLGRIRDAVRERDDLAALRQEHTQGAALRVETKWEHVEFMASATSGELETIVSFLGPAIFEATWTQDDVVTAKEIMARGVGGAFGAGEASAKIYYLFQRALLGDCPLAQPIFGSEETRQNITLADVRSFYRSYYVPNLTSVCVVSPRPTAEVIDSATRAFAKYETRAVSKPAPPAAAPPDSRVETGTAENVRSAVLIVGVPLPPPGSDGFVMGQVMYAALSGPRGLLAMDKTFSTGQSLASRITRRSAVAVPIPTSSAPYLAAFAQAEGTAVESARQGILRLLLGFADRPLSAEALSRAKTRAMHLEAVPMASPAAAATALNRRALVSDGPQTQDDFAARVDAVTAEDVQQFAKKQFTRHAVGLLMPD